ncbi:capreomycidine synthase [Streptomyces sp. NBC_00963]|uniref:capreomycidine synthase n=1 Tax=unclassified Streptomyces TaxID=2593676 RepID=UPI0022569282|nr:capreomycidine synthase [Streptomyces sp. NBC_01306]MCX4728900.1 capreomycidine synthase [Streptomyces sp. NBC_01306]WSX46382.1 capreomycidine synthase [Streptomyces sp. NBC_00963]
MELPLAKLEEWMRRYYHAVDHDIGSSGVRDLTVGELCHIADFDLAELADLPFHDSEPLGGRNLRAALADRWTGGDSERVMVTHGSSEAIWLVMQTLVRPGDDVIVVDPAYQQLHDIAVARGCRLRRWDLSSGDGFAADTDRLRKLVAAERPRMIVVNFPHNPTGITITREQQDELIEIAAAAGAWLVWDNAFGELTYEGDTLPLPHDRYARSLSFGTFSKSYGLAGIRTGWCLAPPEMLTEMAYLRDYVALYVSPVLEFFAERAVRNADRIVAMQRAHAGQNRELLLAWAGEHPDRVRLTPPAGGVSALVELRGVQDVTEVCRRLAEEYRTLLIPGECFGDAYRNHVRLGFGGTRAELTAGLANLDVLLKS